jgi:hypothetical protein
MRRRPLDRKRASAYARKLGLRDAAEHSEKSWRTRAMVQRGAWWVQAEPEWQHSRRGVQTWMVALALFDSTTRIAPRAMTSVRHLTIDVDVHDEPPAGAWAPGELEDLDLSAVAGPAATRAGNRRAREWRAERARACVAQLAAMGVADVVTWSPRGWHVTTLLDEDVHAAEAAELSAAIASRVELADGVTVESFPKLRSDGLADGCAFPLLGPSRRSNADLVKPLGSRKEALEELLTLPGHSLGELRALVASSPSTSPPRSDRRPPTAAPLAPERAEADGQLFGRGYVTHVLGLLQHGIPAGASYDEVRRAYAAARYCGRDHGEARRILAAWLDLPIHGARHCETAAGRRQLLRLVDAQGRHFKRGLDAGRCREDGLKSRELRAAFAQLLDARHDVQEAPCNSSPLPTAATTDTSKGAGSAGAARASSSKRPPSKCPTFASSSRVASTALTACATGTCASSPSTSPTTRVSRSWSTTCTRGPWAEKAAREARVSLSTTGAQADGRTRGTQHAVSGAHDGTTSRDAGGTQGAHGSSTSRVAGGTWAAPEAEGEQGSLARQGSTKFPHRRLSTSSVRLVNGSSTAVRGAGSIAGMRPKAVSTGVQASGETGPPHVDAA